MNNRMYKKNELYNKALSNVHRYSLLNEIFAIRDERFKNEQQDTMLCVNGYIGINTLDRYVRNIDELVEYQNIDTIENLKEKDKEIERLNNIIDELEWKPIDEYFKNKENYDWVLIKYYDKYNFECIPSVAEYRCGKWYLKDNDEPLQDFEIRYFFDMKQLDKLKELKEGK